ncbi:MAG: hypothetical protein JXA46_18160 [Dehalococcoidales bacterium]|nr:hypothetical protein [Dehalococcoidales bacterium]
MSNQYEVLSPLGEIDPIPPRGISPRLADLTGKKIGIFCNYKPAARPILKVVEKKLKERYPDCQTSWYEQTMSYPVTKMNAEDRQIFDDWVKSLDGVIAALGD